MEKFKWSYFMVVILGVGFASGTYAEVKGIDPKTQCLGAVNYISDITKALANLTPETAAKYYDATNKQFIFCIDPNMQPMPKVKTVTAFTNNSEYPIIINNLVVDSSSANLAQSLLTIASGKSPIVLQNTTATGIKGTLSFQGNVTLLNSTITCDSSMQDPAITMNTSSNNFSTLRNVKINDCAAGLAVYSAFNNFYNVSITKTAVTENQLGTGGVLSTGTANSFFGLIVSGYKNGATVWGNKNAIQKYTPTDGSPAINSKLTGLTIDSAPVANTIGVYAKGAQLAIMDATIDGYERGVLVAAANDQIKNSTLGGSLGAVVIMDGFTPTTVTEDTFTTEKTIVYLDATTGAVITDANSPHHLLGVEWMGKHVPDGADYADRIVGKLLDQSNTSTVVEFDLNRFVSDKVGEQVKYLLTPHVICPVSTAQEDIPMAFTDSKTAAKITRTILKGEKFFDCSTEVDGKTPLNISLKNIARYMSNTPTVSFMTDNVYLSDLGDITVLISAPTVVTDPGAGSVQAPPAPSPTPDVPATDGEGSSQSAGNNAIGDGISLGGEIPSVTGGASEAGGGGLKAGGCTLQPSTSQPSLASLLIWLIPLLPISFLLPYRKERGR